MERSTFYTYWSAFIAVIGGFLQSYVACVIAGALFFVVREFALSNAQEGFAASIILLGALAGSLGAGSLADRMGRRFSLQLSAFLFFLTGIGIFFAQSLSFFLILRFITGLAAGITAILSPLYLAEIAPAPKRGAFVASFQFAVT